MLVGYLTPEAVVPQALLYNKTERGSFCYFSNVSYFKKAAMKSALEQNGQGLILTLRMFYQVGISHKVRTSVDATLTRTNVTKKIQELFSNFASLFDVLKVSAAL